MEVFEILVCAQDERIGTGEIAGRFGEGLGMRVFMLMFGNLFRDYLFL